MRADADLHVGKELIVVPDDALIEGEPRATEPDHEAATVKTDEGESRGWEARASEESTRSSIWTRRAEAPPPIGSETPPEKHLRTETARPVENYRPAPEESPEASQRDLENEAVTIAPKDQSQA